MKKIPLLRQLIRRNPEITEKELYARILCGETYVAGEKIRDPERLIPFDAAITFGQKKFVSRGGVKLDYALREWEIDVSGKVFVDAGCSTGGFTQALLLRGASHVHAVDVGYNQLDYSLRTRPDVSVHERTNILKLTSFSPSPDAAVVDVSFRPVVPVIQHLFPLLKDKWIIALIKPQFELKNPDENFNGIIRKKEIHADILRTVVHSLWDAEIYPVSIVESPIPGRKGNREFLFKIAGSAAVTLEGLNKIVSELL